jgi:hypothetical protein
MESQEIVTRAAIVRLGADGILRIISLPGAEETLDDAKQIVAASRQLVQGTPRPMLVDLRDIRSHSREARQLYARPESSGTLRAAAILVGSPISRVIGNFALGFNKLVVPTRLFTSEAEALDWLKGFLA